MIWKLAHDKSQINIGIKINNLGLFQYSSSNILPKPYIVPYWGSEKHRHL